MQIDLDAMQQAAGRATQLLKSLGNESRLMILCRLLDGEKSVGELERAIGLGQSALSQHLAVLRREGLVATRRQAQAIYYRLEGEEASRVLEALHDLYCGPAEADAAATKARGAA